MLESDENLQEKDKEYMRKQNVNHHSDELEIKLSKDVGKHSTKCAGGNIHKSAEYIFGDREEKTEDKNIKKWGTMLKWKS